MKAKNHYLLLYLKNGKRLEAIGKDKKLGLFKTTIFKFKKDLNDLNCIVLIPINPNNNEAACSTPIIVSLSFICGKQWILQKQVEAFKDNHKNDIKKIEIEKKNVEEKDTDIKKELENDVNHTEFEDTPTRFNDAVPYELSLEFQSEVKSSVHLDLPTPNEKIESYKDRNIAEYDQPAIFIPVNTNKKTNILDQAESDEDHNPINYDQPSSFDLTDAHNKEIDIDKKHKLPTNKKKCETDENKQTTIFSFDQIKMITLQQKKDK